MLKLSGGLSLLCSIASFNFSQTKAVATVCNSHLIFFSASNAATISQLSYLSVPTVLSLSSNFFFISTLCIYQLYYRYLPVVLYDLSPQVVSSLCKSFILLSTFYCTSLSNMLLCHLLPLVLISSSESCM